MGAVCQLAKRCFCCLFFCFWCFVFFLCFCSFWGKSKPSKGYFLQFYRVFPLSFPQKARLQNPYLLPILFFLVFLVSPLSKFHFSLFLSINLFLENIFHFLYFPILMFACLFETNSPNIPFFKTNLLSFLAFFFCCFCFCFHVLCFCLSVRFTFFGVCYSFVFVLLFVCFLFCFHCLSDYEKHCFPCNFTFYVMLVRR